eukprot:CAMPEP_0116889440 /NCGR_PEP_ID=MMETSP0463-20121206/24918_1 /TAXON_ID=181622 /ORGANISM="Strombidinopsis sp, Strain SopsisLIS2011" /LENGTH=64 /DNA_ID=CAMNT_0004556119 /DNA_START=44 /DNA_END=238 /DNA_ORIENTATION=+
MEHGADHYEMLKFTAKNAKPENTKQTAQKKQIDQFGVTVDETEVNDNIRGKKRKNTKKTKKNKK